MSIYKEFNKGGLNFMLVCSDEMDDPINNYADYKFFSTNDKHYTNNECKEISDKSGCMYNVEGFNNTQEIESFLKKNDYLYLKIGAYEDIDLTVYPCKEVPSDFNNYLFGFLYMPKNEIREIYHCKRVSKTIATDVLNNMENFVRFDWNDYFLGDIYDVYVSDENDKDAETTEYVCQLRGQEDIKNYISDIRVIS